MKEFTVREFANLASAMAYAQAQVGDPHFDECWADMSFFSLSGTTPMSGHEMEAFAERLRMAFEEAPFEAPILSWRKSQDIDKRRLLRMADSFLRRAERAEDQRNFARHLIEEMISRIHAGAEYEFAWDTDQGRLRASLMSYADAIDERAELATELAETRESEAKMRVAIAKFLAASGHDLCHENRKELAASAGLEAPEPQKPKECEFRRNCDAYAAKIYHDRVVHGVDWKDQHETLCAALVETTKPLMDLLEVMKQGENSPMAYVQVSDLQNLRDRLYALEVFPRT